MTLFQFGVIKLLLVNSFALKIVLKINVECDNDNVMQANSLLGCIMAD